MATKAPTKLVTEKKVPPKPESLRIKEERNTKYAEALNKAREQRRVDNKARRADVLKRSQTHLQNYQNAVNQETKLRR